jgi:flavin-dependent dehydrogenase
LNHLITIKSRKDTDFSDSLGPGGYAWNVVRSEADQLFYNHAKMCGAQTYDGTKINEIEFVPNEDKDYPADPKIPDPGRAVSVAWSRKDGSSGKITFDYIVDASGRAGVISTKHLKNRMVNEGLEILRAGLIGRVRACMTVDRKGINQPSSKLCRVFTLHIVPRQLSNTD